MANWANQPKLGATSKCNIMLLTDFERLESTTVATIATQANKLFLV